MEDVKAEQSEGKVEKHEGPSMLDCVAPLTEKEKYWRGVKKQMKEFEISLTKAAVMRNDLVDAYKILDRIRFDYLGDTAFRDKIVRARINIESALGDYLLDDAYWRKKIKDYREKYTINAPK